MLCILGVEDACKEVDTRKGRMPAETGQNPFAITLPSSCHLFFSCCNASREVVNVEGSSGRQAEAESTTHHHHQQGKHISTWTFFNIYHHPRPTSVSRTVRCSASASTAYLNTTSSVFHLLRFSHPISHPHQHAKHSILLSFAFAVRLH